MKKTGLIFGSLLVLAIVTGMSHAAGWFGIPNAVPGSFRAQQLQHDSVKKAYELRWDTICVKLRKLHVDSSKFEVFLRNFKQEGVLEVWVKEKSDSVWKYYDAFSRSKGCGLPGPKRCRNDHQIPEGFYTIRNFIPHSPRNHIEMETDYPNQSDKYFSKKQCGSNDPGDAIMIHGEFGSNGCVALSYYTIKELYVLCVEARNAGQKTIHVHMFPTRMTPENMSRVKRLQPDTTVYRFWENIQPGYDYFESKRQVPDVTIGADGKYNYPTR